MQPAEEHAHLALHGLSFLVHNSSAAEWISPLLFLQSPFATLILVYVKCIKYITYNNTYTPTSADTLAEGGRKAKKRLNNDNNGAARGLTVKDAI